MCPCCDVVCCVQHTHNTHVVLVSDNVCMCMCQHMSRWMYVDVLSGFCCHLYVSTHNTQHTTHTHNTQHTHTHNTHTHTHTTHNTHTHTHNTQHTHTQHTHTQHTTTYTQHTTHAHTTPTLTHTTHVTRHNMFGGLYTMCVMWVCCGWTHNSAHSTYNTTLQHRYTTTTHAHNIRMLYNDTQHGEFHTM